MLTTKHCVEGTSVRQVTTAGNQVKPRAGDASRAKLPHVLHHADLWRDYNADPDNTQLRDQLAELYTGWVWHLAGYFRRARSKRHSLDDLFSAGYLQMLKLMRAFRADGGANFVGYSRLSILGAMTQLDVDHAAAFACRHRILSIQKNEANRRGHRINDFELAVALGISEQGLLCKIRYPQLAIGGALTEVEAAEITSPAVDQEQAMELPDLVHEALGRLPSRWENVMRLHYLEDVPTSEIAAAYGVSVTMVSSILRRSRIRLASILPKSIVDGRPARSDRRAA